MFREPLARLAEGDRVAVPLGHFLAYSWGVTASRGVSWPPEGRLTGRDGGVSARLGPLEVGVSGRSLWAAVHLPGTSVQAEGGRLGCGGFTAALGDAVGGVEHADHAAV